MGKLVRVNAKKIDLKAKASIQTFDIYKRYDYSMDHKIWPALIW